MKSKKIVALALTAAMAISMASMTAFAGDTVAIHPVKDAAKLIYLESESKDGDTTTITKVQVSGFNYNIMKADAAAATDIKETKTYAFKKANGSKVSESSETINGKTKIIITKDFDTNELNDIALAPATASYEFSFDKIKAGLPTYTDRGRKHIGWATSKPNADVAAGADDATINAAILNSADDDDDCDCGVSDTSLGTVAFSLWPVWQTMSQEEKDAQRNGEADAAVDPKTNNKYKGYEVSTVKKEMGATEGESALETCHAKSVKSRVYDIKPYGQSDYYDTDDTNPGVAVNMLEHQKTEVELPIPDECKKDNGDYKNLKVFHIDSKGKATQLKITVDGDNKKVKFKTGDFSTFVLTWDPRSITTDSEGNPATGEASTLPVALLAVAALSATGVVAYKKRKAE